MSEEYPPLTDRELDQLASTYRLGWEGFADEEALAILRLVAEVRRLRTREAALVAALSEYAKSENWGEFWNTDDDGHTTGVIGATGVWAGPGAEPYDIARKALAADPSAPATTEGRP